ncbi:MAG: FkbM family methyltransferase [Candidatus Nanopelagicales bacterium]|nr:FkbM family methyltransferase [Candidatus Nanopelagicales bacterium]
MKSIEPVELSRLLGAIPELLPTLRRGTKTFDLVAQVAARAAQESGFASGGSGETLGEFGHVVLPFRKMGAIDTLDLLGLDELVVFCFYFDNRDRYSTAADLGANCGLHSLLMARLGWRVEAYEPDPDHVAVIRENLRLNRVEKVEVHQKAASDADGAAKFIRVLGNTTGSHIAGAKTSPYGELETFEVECEGIRSIMSRVDFIKMDVEGQEAKIIRATRTDDWRGTDVMLEVGTAENARAIYEHLSALGVAMFPQKIGWVRAHSADDLPSHHSQGSLFASLERVSPWSGNDAS